MSRSLASVPLAHRVAAIACASVVLVAGCSGSTSSPRATSALAGSPGASASAKASAVASATAGTSAGASAATSPGASAGASSTTTGGLRLPEPDKTPALQVVDVSGLGKVLADEHGMVVYQDKEDPADSSACIEQCATTWPPLVIVPGTTVQAMTGVTGTIGSIVRPDGQTQVTYDGHPLYFYSLDPKPMTSKGQGVSADWSAVTP